MAANVDVTCVFREAMDVAEVLQELQGNGRHAGIKRMFSMDNWRWEGRREVQDLSEVRGLLRDQRIIVVNAHVDPFRDFGFYLEKNGDKYVHDFWIDTEGFPELDSDIIQPQNRWFYDRLQDAVNPFLERHASDFELLSAGVETVLSYRGNAADTIRATEGVILWMVPGRTGQGIDLQGYRRTIINGVVTFRKEKFDSGEDPAAFEQKRNIKGEKRFTLGDPWR